MCDRMVMDFRRIKGMSDLPGETIRGALLKYQSKENLEIFLHTF